MKIQGQGHGQGQTWWSHLRPNVQSICLLFVSWQSNHFWLRYIANSRFDLEAPFPRHNLTVKIQGQRYPSHRSIQLTHFLFCFTSNGPTIPKIWQLECSTGENAFSISGKKLLKKVSDRIPPKFNQVESMIRGIYWQSFVAIGWAVLTWSWGQGRICPALVTWWPWPNVTEMATKKISHTTAVVETDQK